MEARTIVVRTFGWLLALGFAAGTLAAEPLSGEVEFQCVAEEHVPERFRLAPHRFSFEQTPLETISQVIELSEVTFPSPVETSCVPNNTVYCEYFRPKAEGKYPAVVVLHILGGDFELSRLFARAIAHQGAAALFLKMPYYGPRREPGGRSRVVTEDPRETAAGMTQAVLDIRRGAMWLATRAEVDPEQLGVFGISLGGITAALAASAEPRFANVCTMLAGGDIHQVIWESPELEKYRRRWEDRGITQQMLVDNLRLIDPCTYAERVRGRRILMLNASHDEVIPRRCTESLWRTMGEPEIEWIDAGHYSAIFYVLHGTQRVSQFFAASGQPQDRPAE